MPHDTPTVSMRMTAKESKSMMEPAEAKVPEYPYGLRIRLGAEELKKLGLKELPPVDTELMVYAKSYVCSVTSHESSEGQGDQSLELQITDLALMPAKEKEAAEKKLYGG